MTSHPDSDGDLPLIDVSHHLTSEEAFDHSEYDIDNIPFIRCSQKKDSSTTSTSPDLEKCSMEFSTSDTVHVPNAQREKYNITSLTSSDSNKDSSLQQ